MLDKILSKLQVILIPFKKFSKGWKDVARSIIQHSSKTVKGRLLCNSYHMEVAQGNSCLLSTENIPESTCLEGLSSAYPDRERASP